MVDNLGKNKSIKPSENNIDIPNFIFGKEMTDENFLVLFETLISDIKSKKPENGNKIKSFFKKVGYDALFSILDTNDVLAKIKKDIVIQYLVDKGIFNNASDVKSQDSQEILTGIADKEFSLEKITLDFPEIKLSNGKTVKINKELITKFLKSETILSAAKETLSKFKDSKLNAIEINNLKNYAESFIKNEFYNIRISDTIFAFTIYNSNIFINKKYIDYVKNDTKKSLSALAIILTTIFHEYIHFLVRTISDENNSNNYFLRTKNRPKKNNIVMNEAGKYFDNLLLGKYYGFYSIDAEFILDIDNYNVDYKIFKEKYFKNHDKNFEKIDYETFLQRTSINDESYLARGRCFFDLGYQSDEENN